jgi:integrase
MNTLINKGENKMSALYKRKDSPYWWFGAMYRGRRVAQSTRMTNKKLAKKIAEEWDLNLILGKLDFIGHSTLPLFSDFKNKYLIFIAKRKSENAVTIAKGVLRKFNDYLMTQKIKRIEGITVRTMDRYTDTLTKTVKDENGGLMEIPVATKTKRNHLQVISSMFDQAIKEELVKSNPAKLASLPQRKDEIKVRENRLLEPIDLKIIFEGAGSWSLYYAFLYHTGLRAGDVAKLTYGNIDFKKRAIVSFIRKTRKIHEFPIAEFLIKQLPKGISKESPLFPDVYAENEVTLNGKIAKPRKFMQALLKAGSRPHATLHSFRHTFNSTLRDLGMSIEDRQVLLAHASSETNKIYTHPNFNLASDYVNKVPKYIIKRSNNVAIT